MRVKKLKVVEKREHTKRKGFKFTSWSKEDHKDAIFGIAFNPYTHPDDPPAFATVGSNRVTVYECCEGGFNVIQSYSDPCIEETFYTVCWMYSEVNNSNNSNSDHEQSNPDHKQSNSDHGQNNNKPTMNTESNTDSNPDSMICEDTAATSDSDVNICSESRDTPSDVITSDNDVNSTRRSSTRGQIETRIAVAGQRGLIRVVSLAKLRNMFTLMGCGDSINELKLHPRDSSLLLSASKDNSLRLWNLATRRCVVIFGGLQGHRDEVLSCDFDLQAKFILSCGMDHSIKMWSLEAEGVDKAIKLSYTYEGEKPFPVFNEHFPIFSTRSIHRNYVDCVRWFGNFVLSKSCENKIFCWKPNLEVKKSSDIPDQSEVLHSFDYGNCDIWYMRFAVSPSFDAIAAGNQVGKVFLWDISEEPSKPSILSHQKCSRAIRQVCFSPDSNIMIAVSDDSTVWRWDKT